MQIIPVIDLKDGCVVNARQGDRANYRPLTSSLCASSALSDVISAFLDLADFRTFYIADLNAIMRRGHHNELIGKAIEDFENIHFWLDNGCRIADIGQQRSANVTPVIGTESQHGEIEKTDANFVLSLDYKGDTPLGHPALFADQNLWPREVILMTLGRVGSHTGPDFSRLAEYRKKHPGTEFVAAGGIRDGKDLDRLGELGIGKSLVASALHSGAIGPADLKKWQAKKYPV